MKQELALFSQIQNLRRWGDGLDSFCVPITLHELGAMTTGKDLPSPSHISRLCKKLDIKGKNGRLGAINPDSFFDNVIKYANFLDLQIIKILANPSGVKNFPIPEELTNQVEVATGERSIMVPAMHILAVQENDNCWSGHSETDDGELLRVQRIAPRIEAGFVTLMVINFIPKVRLEVDK